MIVICCATNDERAFRAGGALAMEAIDEGNSLMLRRHGHESIDVPYNEMRTTAAAQEELEALVLVHQDAVLDVELQLPVEVRNLLSRHDDVEVIVAGPDVESREGREPIAGVLVMSPWAVRSLSFDPAVGGSTDASAQDVALQATAAGRRALMVPLGVSRRWSPAGPRERRRELDARVALDRKWRRAGAPDPR